ncbi:hypothetical protein H0G86_003825 [Trichoderma simmonsii]|uniref:Uncharacterized protein n=1 Tax=Trichoderma simmonsii TaxID=1491479 RepID=A0A8G0PCW4_9HYPO|nr:hypothetical protein H0G86_003825 [Trichoderma simmonsii]
MTTEKKKRVTVKKPQLAKLQPYKHWRLRLQCIFGASNRAVGIDLPRREPLSGHAERRRLRYGQIGGSLSPAGRWRVLLAMEYHPVLLLLISLMLPPKLCMMA